MTTSYGCILWMRRCTKERTIVIARGLPEMFQLAADGKLKIEIVTRQLKDVEIAWQENIPAGKRLVIVI